MIHDITPETPDNPEHYIHTHPRCELYFYISGDCDYVIENGIFKPEYGTAIITRSEEMHGTRIIGDTIYDRYYFHFEPSLEEKFGLPGLLRCFFDRPCGVNNSVVLSPDEIEQCLSLMQKIERLMSEKSPDSNSLSFAAFLEILHIVNTAAENPLGHRENSARSNLVNQAMQYLREHLSEIRTSSDLAAALYVRREYLSRQFSTHMGITLSRYITLKRVALAKTMLAGGASLNEVCSACGWQDYSYFITVFHREVGMSPMKYRESVMK